jgi:hypothetical protein
VHFISFSEAGGIILPFFSCTIFSVAVFEDFVDGCEQQVASFVGSVFYSMVSVFSA